MNTDTRNTTPHFGKKELILAGVILAVTFISFVPMLSNEFTNWDDHTFILNNPAVYDPSWHHLTEIFKKTYVRVYVPLTILSWSIEHYFFGFNAFVFLLDNLLLHCAVTLLVFIFALRLGLPRMAAALAALLFGVHPMHVESVAWASERKDVLFALFYMAALICYGEYRRCGKLGGARFYVASLALGFLSILSKPMALSLPIVLCALDYYEKRRIDKFLFLDKIPYLLYIVPIASITFLQFTEKSELALAGKKLAEAIPIFFFSFSFYIRQFVWPLHLSPRYQLPWPVEIGQWPYILSVLVFLSYAALLIKYRRNRIFIFSFLFFLASIFFMLRFGAVFINKSVVSDRFIYISSVGLCLFLGKLFADLPAALGRRDMRLKLLAYLGLAVIYALLAIKTFTQTQIWKDSITFWSAAIEENPHQAYNATVARGHAHALAKDWPLALHDSNNAIKMRPKAGDAYNLRGIVHSALGKSELALADFNAALENNFIKSDVYINRANLYSEMEKNVLAMADIERAIKIDGNSSKAYALRGKVHGLKGELELAIADLDTSISLDPRDALVYYDRAFFLSRSGRNDEAVADYSRALELKPNDFFTLDQRGTLYFAMGQYELAQEDFHKVLALSPGYARGYNNRGANYLALHQLDAALADLDRAIAIDGNYGLAYRNRSLAYKEKQHRSKALDDARKAQALGAPIDEALMKELESRP